MANQNQAFRQHQITRALKAASAAGMRDPHMRITLPNGTVLHVSAGGEVPTPKPKKTAALRADLAEGGDTSMAGRGDRTKTSDADAAGTQHPGSTAHKTSSRGSLLAAGGSRHGMLKRQAADQAPPGRTAKAQSAASAKEASGGLARPAKPGQTGC
jgi:hypothetical protein